MGQQLEAPRPILVIVPAWNEAKSLPATLEELRAENQEIDVLVVDDGSTDATSEIALNAGVLLCALPFNLGVGGAMRAGYRFAHRNGYECAVQFDADGQHDPKAIPKLVTALSESNIVIGARFAGMGNYHVSAARRFVMVVFAAVLSRLAGARLTDVTSGFRAVDAKALAVFAEHYPSEYLGDTVESLVIASRFGCSVGQVPVEMRARREGSPSQGFWSSLIFVARASAALGLGLIRKWPTPEAIEKVVS
jgi:glycosyltransferase involved in cell wall biosynthesis